MAISRVTGRSPRNRAPLEWAGDPVVRHTCEGRASRERDAVNADRFDESGRPRDSDERRHIQERAYWAGCNAPLPLKSHHKGL